MLFEVFWYFVFTSTFSEQHIKIILILTLIEFCLKGFAVITILVDYNNRFGLKDVYQFDYITNLDGVIIK